MTSHSDFLSTALRKPSRNTTTGIVNAEMATVKGPLTTRGQLTVRNDAAEVLLRDASGTAQGSLTADGSQNLLLEAVNELRVEAKLSDVEYQQPGFLEFDRSTGAHLFSGQHPTTGSGYNMLISGAPGTTLLGDGVNMSGGSVTIQGGAGQGANPSGNLTLQTSTSGTGGGIVYFYTPGGVHVVYRQSTAPVLGAGAVAIAGDSGKNTDACGRFEVDNSGGGATGTVTFNRSFPGSYIPIVVISSTDPNAYVSAVTTSGFTVTHDAAATGTETTQYMVMGRGL